MSKPSKRARRRLAATALGVGAALAFAELAYRVVRAPDLGPTTHPAYVVRDPDLGWAYSPGARRRHRSEEFDVEVRIHSRGFRGEEWDLESDASPRVLILGDSFAFGWGVEEHETFSAHLAAEHEDWLVCNAAISGFGTDQELLVLRRLASKVRPDIVVCVFCTNDVYENATAVSYGKPKPRFLLSEGTLGPLEAPAELSFLARHSQLWRAIAKMRWERAHLRRKVSPEDEWRLTLALLEAMKASAGEAPLLIVSEGAAAGDRLAALARRRAGIRHLDLDRVPGESAVEHFAVDGHWTAAGHALVGRALSARLDEWVP
ncbi:MAG: hypothetical protein CMJ84_14775 [Planctomycetes bacterium]|jgi:hypothetical protein|nr:hypothetical protein [Planctomycetota bacterium]MDP6409303.1 SGNH/GDSL hydrolase family protein [Planctomycetota bacterium]